VDLCPEWHVKTLTCRFIIVAILRLSLKEGNAVFKRSVKEYFVINWVGYFAFDYFAQDYVTSFSTLWWSIWAISDFDGYCCCLTTE
jgi:hypothetical protein